MNRTTTPPASGAGRVLPERDKTAQTVLVAAVAAIGGLLFGFDTAVISGTIPFIRPYFGLTDTSLGWAVSALLVGCMIGTAVAGELADRYGRKAVLVLTAVLFAVSTAATALVTSLTMFVVARIAGGLAVGTASMICPVYIAEIAPAEQRGRLVSLYQLTIVIGIVVAFFSNYLLVDTGAHNWRWMFGVEAFPSLVFLGLLFVVPESPRWLARRGRIDAARTVLARFRPAAAVDAEMREIREVLAGEHRGRLSDLFEGRIRPLLLTGIVLAIFQQVTGINTIMYYAPMIFEKTGAGTDSAFLQTIAVGTINFLFTLVAIRLIDHMGRRPLLLWGSVGMALSLGVLATAFFLNAFDGPLVLVSILFYIASFAASLGPVVWVVIAEIFPIKVRGLAVSVATFALWLACFVVSLTFPWLIARLDGGYTFLLYAVLCVANYVFVLRRIPETKGKSLEQIEAEMLGSAF